MNDSLENRDFLPPGTVALVGAGPGDPDLMTLAAVKALKAADVVVHDALVSPEILAMIPPEREILFAGKRGGSPSACQADISDTLISLAKQNKRVVRLKGGDPFVFGRGGEEAGRLVEEGVSFRVIPGLTAGIAGPAYAGIPITHRHVNANVAFITGQESPENNPDEESPAASRMDWENMARTFPVLVLYMAIKNLQPVTQRIMNAGRPPDTPVALIRWATTPQQQTLVTTLEHAVRDVTAVGLTPPAVIIIGEVVNYRSVLAWFGDETLNPERNP